MITVNVEATGPNGPIPVFTADFEVLPRTGETIYVTGQPNNYMDVLNISHSAIAPHSAGPYVTLFCEF